MGRCNVNRNQNCFQCCRSPRRLHNNYFEWVNQHWQRTLWNVVSVQELFFTSHSLLCTTVGVTRPLVHFTHTHADTQTHTHTHMHTETQTHTQTHTHTCRHTRTL